MQLGRRVPLSRWISTAVAWCDPVQALQAAGSGPSCQLQQGLILQQRLCVHVAQHGSLAAQVAALGGNSGYHLQHDQRTFCTHAAQAMLVRLHDVQTTYDANLPQLRPYQQEGVGEILEAFEGGSQRVLYTLATGGGKSVIFAAIAQSYAKRGKRVVIVAHRRELIFQARAHLARWGVKAGTVMAGENGDSSAAVQVASMKTLCSRRLSDAPDLVIVDEAHYSVANMYTSLFKRYPSAQILGCTATPYRLDGKGLGMLFDTLLCGPSIAKLIEQGHLVPPKLVEAGISFHKLNKVAVKMGDYVASKVEQALQRAFAPDQVAAVYKQHASPRQAVVYATSVKHSKDFQAALAAAGFQAVHLDGQTKQSERDAAIAAFGAGEIQLLVSCDIISEGLDVPGIEAIVLVRPTQSYGLYIQQVGRGLRPSPGKEDCLVLDLVGNVAYHGPPTQSLRLGLTMDVTEQTGLKLVPEARPVQADQDRDCARLAMEERMENFRVQAARKSAYRELYRPLQELMPWLEEQALHAGWDKPNDWQLVHVDWPRHPRSTITAAAFLEGFRHENWVAIHHAPSTVSYSVSWATRTTSILESPYSVSWATSMSSILKSPSFTQTIDSIYDFEYHGDKEEVEILEFSSKPDGSVIVHPSIPHTTLHRVYTDHEWGLRHLFQAGYWTSVRGNGRVGAIQTMNQLLLLLSDPTWDQWHILHAALQGITIGRRLPRPRKWRDFKAAEIIDINQSSVYR